MKKSHTVAEIFAIIIATPIVVVFVLLYLVCCFLLFLGTFIRTGSNDKAIKTLEAFVDHGVIKFTGV